MIFGIYSYVVVVLLDFTWRVVFDKLTEITLFLPGK